MLKDLAPLTPSGFFELVGAIPDLDKKKKRVAFLPDTSGLLGEEKFADIALYWTDEGIQVILRAQKSIDEVLFPAFSEGDSLELFFDTRDLKTASAITRFCHHFVFLPEDVEGIQAQEITRFRSEDAHKYADPALFVIETEVKRSRYEMTIEIPKQALYGYDPREFQRLGFTYRINRPKGDPQHFAASSHFYAIERHPELWASFEFS